MSSHAIQTNLLANGVIAATAGLTYLWTLGRILRRALQHAPPMPAEVDALLVLGHGLEAGHPSEDFRRRLDCTLAFVRQHPEADIMILGGQLADQPCSEAAAGRDYLVARGLEASLIGVEEQSRNTLENLQQAIGRLPQGTRAAVVLITSRYHLQRSEIMARNLGLNATAFPAEPGMAWSAGLVVRLLWEAYLLHWYHVGVTYARLTGHHCMLARVWRAAPQGRRS